MLERLKLRAHDEGLSNLQIRVMDGQALRLEDDTFDISGSQFGVMLFPDLPRGLREMVRVTKPGGRVLMNVFGDVRQNEFLTFFIKAVKAAVPGFNGPSMDDPPLPFQVADPETLRRRMAEAGLRDISVETITEELQFQSGEQMWDWLMNSNPIPGMLIADVTEEQRAVARQVLDGMLRERAGGSDVARLTVPVNIGIGTK